MICPKWVRSQDQQQQQSAVTIARGGDGCRQRPVRRARTEVGALFVKRCQARRDGPPMLVVASARHQLSAGASLTPTETMVTLTNAAAFLVGLLSPGLNPSSDGD